MNAEIRTAEELLAEQREERRVAAMPGVGPLPSAVTNINALWKAREAVQARREKGLAPPASPFLDAVAGYDAPQSYNPPPRKRRKQSTGQEAGIEKSLPNGDQAL